MGRTWKFTNEIYEELKENVDKKVETQFCSGVLGSGQNGVFGNPFEKYAYETNMGITKMNDYVDMINEAGGFNRTKLDQVFGQIAEIDKSYSNQINNCVIDLEHYKDVLYQLEVVMGEAAIGSVNGLAVFHFDKSAFQEKMKEIDVAYVDRILSKDASEITAEEYQAIAILIAKQTPGDTTLIEHILTSTYCWEMVNCDSFDYEDIDPVTGGPVWGLGYFTPTQQYLSLMEALSNCAMKVSSGEMEIEGGMYKNVLANLTRYEQLFRSIAEVAPFNWVEYDLTGGMAGIQDCLDNMFQIEAGETTIKGEEGLKVTIQGTGGYLGSISFEILGYVPSERSVNVLNALQNAYINFYLNLDASDQQVLQNSIVGGIANTVGNSVVSKMLGGTVTTALEFAGGVVKDVREHHEKQSTIYEYEQLGGEASTLELLNLNAGVVSVNYHGELANEITLYPEADTQARLDTINQYLKSDEFLQLVKDAEAEKDTNDNEKNEEGSILDEIPENGFDLDYVLQHLNEVDIIFDKIDQIISGNEDYDPDSFQDALKKFGGWE